MKATKDYRDLVLDKYLSASAIDIEVHYCGITKSDRNQHEQDNWKIFITSRKEKKSASFDFHTGSGLRVESKGQRIRYEDKKTGKYYSPVTPTPSILIESLLIDYDVASQNFQSYCEDFGLDPDSMSVFLGYKATCENAKNFREVIGNIDQVRNIIAL